MKPQVHSLFPDIDKVPEFFRDYVNAVDCLADPIQLLKDDIHWQLSLLDNCPGLDLEYRYQPEKWTLRQLVVHVIDAELVMGFRMLAAVRNDSNNYPGYDYESYAEQTANDSRNWAELRAAWKTVRKQTQSFCESIDQQSWVSECTVDGRRLSASLLLYITLGHPRIHFETIRKRYIP
ncbi:MAG: DinB family protein [Saprospirales bacterium]|nr:MAG: DinB family protein [Saprospirales bacterium]